jgi:serine/threonine protein phosphatase PrpC
VIGFNEIEYASHTDVGVRRSHNQDAHAVMAAKDDEHWQEVGHVFLVADGMGGHAVGELAAKIAVDNIPHIFSKYAKEGNAVSALRRAFVETNSIINIRGEQNREFNKMGTTGIALVLRPEGAWVGHVGDSRAYRVRSGVIEQLSFDHSFLWELARRQRKNPEELIGIPANRILRSLGPDGSVQVDVEGPHPLERGDVFLLCSDGLSGQVNDRVIGAVVTALPPAEAVRFLVHLANLQGGPDNTTVIVVRVGGEPRDHNMDSSSTDVVFPSVDHPNPFVPRFALMMYYLGKLPWAFILLALGIVLAGIAIAGGSIFVFIFAALALLGGIVTLMLQHIRETRKVTTEPETRVLQVYRQTPCPLDAAIYDRLAQSAQTLENDIKEKAWEYDVNTYQEELKLAAVYAKQERYRDAFREQCRAMLVLMEAVHLYRGKNEDFKPVWDRPAS